MFWLPQGWVPYYAEWLLSFPRAPLGSVSIQAWVLACGTVILLVSDAIVATIRLVMETSTRTAQKAKTEPMEFSGEKPAAGNTPAQAGGGKKEL
jgi:tail-anchored protein insertion receptor